MADFDLHNHVIELHDHLIEGIRSSIYDLAKAFKNDNKAKDNKISDTKDWINIVLPDAFNKRWEAPVDAAVPEIDSSGEMMRNLAEVPGGVADSPALEGVRYLYDEIRNYAKELKRDIEDQNTYNDHRDALLQELVKDEGEVEGQFHDAYDNGNNDDNNN